MARGGCVVGVHGQIIAHGRFAARRGDVNAAALLSSAVLAHTVFRLRQARAPSTLHCRAAQRRRSLPARSAAAHYIRFQCLTRVLSAESVF